MKNYFDLTGQVAVVTGASEATALGNIAVQAVNVGELGGYEEVMESFSSLLESKYYEPCDALVWAQGWEKFANLNK